MKFIEVIDLNSDWNHSFQVETFSHVKTSDMKKMITNLDLSIDPDCLRFIYKKKFLPDIDISLENLVDNDQTEGIILYMISSTSVNKIDTSSFTIDPLSAITANRWLNETNDNSATSDTLRKSIALHVEALSDPVLLSPNHQPPVEDINPNNHAAVEPEAEPIQWLHWGLLFRIFLAYMFFCYNRRLSLVKKVIFTVVGVTAYFLQIGALDLLWKKISKYFKLNENNQQPPAEDPVQPNPPAPRAETWWSFFLSISRAEFYLPSTPGILWDFVALFMSLTLSLWPPWSPGLAPTPVVPVGNLNRVAPAVEPTTQVEDGIQPDNQNVSIDDGAVNGVEEKVNMDEMDSKIELENKEEIDGDGNKSDQNTSDLKIAG